MIDLEKEREAFEAKYLLSDKGIVFDKEKGTFFFKDLNLSDSDEQFLILIRKLWVGWLACAESKQAEINELKAKLEKAQAVPDYPTFEFGYGQIEVAEGVFQGAYALMFGKNGGGVVGADTQWNRHVPHDEVLAICKFNNIQSLDVVIGRLNRLKERMENNDPVEIKNSIGEVVGVVYPAMIEAAQGEGHE